MQLTSLSPYQQTFSNDKSFVSFHQVLDNAKELPTKFITLLFSNLSNEDLNELSQTSKKIYTLINQERRDQLYSLNDIPVECTSKLCTFLSIKEVGRLSRTNRQFCNLINLDKGNVIWTQIAKNYQIEINTTSCRSVKAQVSDPWLVMPFGKMNEITYEIVIKKTFLSISPIEELEKRENVGYLYYLEKALGALIKDISPIFSQYIPKEYYLQVSYNYLDVMLYFILHKDESKKPQCAYSLSVDDLAQQNEVLSKTLKLCTGKVV